MKYLTKEQILLIHSMQIDEYGGLHGVRDYNIIHGLEESPRQKVFGTELYATVFEKAAVYIRNIIFFHPFIDGNKRTAMVSMAVFLESNGWKLEAVEGEIESFALKVVHEKMEIKQISKWLEVHSRKIKAGKR